MKIVHNLSQSPYSFNSSIGTFNDRFILKFTDKILGVDNFEIQYNDVLVWKKDKAIFISSENQNIKGVAVFDISGNKIYTKEKVDTDKLTIQNLFSGYQILLVKVTLENGNSVTKKVSF